MTYAQWEWVLLGLALALTAVAFVWGRTRKAVWQYVYFGIVWLNTAARKHYTRLLKGKTPRV